LRITFSLTVINIPCHLIYLNVNKRMNEALSAVEKYNKKNNNYKFYY